MLTLRSINFFVTETGKSPVAEFLDNLSSKSAQKMTWVMQLVEELEQPPAQYFKKLTNTKDIWEIRVQCNGNAFRVLGFFDEKKIFIATNGFQKKTQKTPRNEIELAEERKHIYLKGKEL